VIAPKIPKPSKADEKRAYEAATERDAYTCVRCGRLGPIERDHRQNRSQGGPTAPSNLQCLCPPCHMWKTQNPAAAVLEGFACPGWARPEFWPAWRHDVAGWVVYFDQPDSRGRWWDEITQATADLLMRGGD
jgi:hypothetical protein